MQANAAFWANRPVCVTGGAGFLGFHLVQQLRRLRARVRVFGLRPGPKHPLWALADVAQHCGDIRDAAAVRRGVAGCTVVFHTAGTVAAWGPAIELMREVHLQGTRNVLTGLDEGAPGPHLQRGRRGRLAARRAARRGQPLQPAARRDPLRPRQARRRGDGAGGGRSPRRGGGEPRLSARAGRPRRLGDGPAVRPRLEGAGAAGAAGGTEPGGRPRRRPGAPAGGRAQPPAGGATSSAARTTASGPSCASWPRRRAIARGCCGRCRGRCCSPSPTWRSCTAAGPVASRIRRWGRPG